MAYKNFSVRVDTTGPAVTILLPEDGDPIGSGSMPVSGTAVDALTPAGVTVYYIVNSSSTMGVPSSLTGWTQANGGANWSNNAALDNFLGEGTRYLHVVADDSLGNRSAVATRKFIRDTAAPQIDSFSFTGGVQTFTGDSLAYAKPAYGFTFNAYDANQLSSVAVKIGADTLNPDGAPHAESFGTYTLARTEINAKTTWQYVLNFTAQADGDYSFSIDILDVLNKENVTNNNTSSDYTDDHKTFNVRVDTTAPTLNVTNPVAGSDISAAAMLVSGTAADATLDGLSVWYSIGASSTAAAPPHCWFSFLLG